MSETRMRVAGLPLGALTLGTLHLVDPRGAILRVRSTGDPTP